MGLGANPFDLRSCVPMSRDDEHACAVEYVKTRDPRLAERLILANTRLVVMIARHHCRPPTDLRDLIQEGNQGLVRAVAGYDPTRSIKLGTYAAWWIRAYILKFTIDNWRLVKVGTTQAQRKLFFSLRKRRSQLERKGGDVDPAALAAHLQVKESDVVAMLGRFACSETSLDAPLTSPDAGTRTVGDLLSATAALRPDERVEESEFVQILQSKLKTFGDGLAGRDAQIFQRRLLSEDPATLTQLAATFGVTRERARQVEQRLKVRIRDYLLDELGDAIPVKAPNSAILRRKETIVLEGS